MREELDTPDRRIARLAGRRHGVVTFAQLVAAGLDKSAIGRRVRAGRLHRVHRGVYAVGHLGLGNEGRWLAAVLACGAGAVLSHRSAAELWGMLVALAGGPVHVSVPTAAGRASRRGVVVHRSPSSKGATAIRRAIPVTTPQRTLRDLRRVEPAGVYRRAVRQAEFAGLVTGEGVGDGTRSELERRFLSLCRRHGLPAPEVNAPVGRWTVDFLWVSSSDELSGCSRFARTSRQPR